MQSRKDQYKQQSQPVSDIITIVIISRNFVITCYGFITIGKGEKSNE